MDAETIVTKVIAMVACLMCATPLLIISKYQKNSQEHLSLIKKECDVTLITKVADFDKFLTNDIYAADLYNSIVHKKYNIQTISEYRQPIIRVD